MYYENIITFFSCHNIFTITEISFPYRSKKKEKKRNTMSITFSQQILCDKIFLMDKKMILVVGSV